MAELVQRIEEYADGGVYDPAKHETVVADIDKAEAIFNRIIDGYIDTTQMPPMQQTIEVSELQKRLHHVKHDLPLAPVEFVDSSRSTDEQVAIYTLPT